MKKGASVQHTDSRGNTPLAYAALGGLKDTKIYDLFLNHGVNIKQKYKDGAEIFHYAISNDDENLAITNYFLSKGVPLAVKDNFGRNIADYASKGQNLNLLKKLIEKGIKPSSEALLFATKGSKNGKKLLISSISSSMTLKYLSTRQMPKVIMPYITHFLLGK